MEAAPAPWTSKGLVDLGRRHAFYTRGDEDRFNLVALHRMNMHHLRGRLLKQAAVVFGKGVMTDEDSELLTSLMRDYCTAVRDRDLMRDCANRDRERNPFLLTSAVEMEDALLKSCLAASDIHPEPVIRADEDARLPPLPGGPWDVPAAAKFRRQRYTGVVVGGAVLVVPMILTVLLRSTTANLVIASVSTMIFAVGATYFSPTKLAVELLGVTAAYAAVLVVFVGGAAGGALG